MTANSIEGIDMAVIGAFLPGTELAGKVALVTGASRKLGREIARALACGGATVAINARTSRDEAESVAEEIRTAGGQAAAFLADVTDAEAVRSMVQGIVAQFGRIDILVLNAAIRAEVPFLEMSYEEWRRPLAMTLDGAFYCMQACLPEMLRAGGGSIVTLGGLSSLTGAKRRVHGSVAKNGLLGMTRAVAREFGEHNVRANCVAPGRMITEPRPHRTTEPNAEAMIPLGRKGDRVEVAAAVRFLCGPGASFISGQTVYVNGGQYMH
jgi:3-oxoacyl-[acyl-carrier protein] reductase